MLHIIKRLQEIRNIPTEKMDVKAFAAVLRDIASCAESAAREIEEYGLIIQDFHLSLADPAATYRKGELTIDFIELYSYKEKE